MFNFGKLTSRCIVSSFINNFTKSRDAPTTTTSPFSPIPAPARQQETTNNHDPAQTYMTPATTSPRPYNNITADDSPRQGRERSSSRPMSMIQTYQPPLMDVAQDTLPELQPIFTFLNSHGNKLYQEGYFLKLDDQDTCTYSDALIVVPI
jgi:CCR4-NOT transcriptional complex subunit CAF120